jgi:hypothetical protein
MKVTIALRKGGIITYEEVTDLSVTAEHATIKTLDGMEYRWEGQQFRDNVKGVKLTTWRGKE